MNPRFEEHEGQLFRMLEEHEIVPLKENDANVLVRFITHGVIGEYVREHWLDCNQENVPIYIDDVDSDGDVTVWIDENRNEHHCCPFPMFEIIGYPVEEGSHWWALYQMMQGKWVYNPYLEKHKSDKLDTRCLHAYSKFGQDVVVKNILTGVDSILGAANISHWTNYAEPTGWQIYKEPESPVDPKERPLRNLILQAKEEGKNIRSFYQNLIFTPNALTDLLANNMFRWWYIGNWELTDEEQNYYPQMQFEVGDLVEYRLHGDTYYGKICNIRGYVYYLSVTTEEIPKDQARAIMLESIIRKLSPREVVIHIGCLSGTVEKAYGEKKGTFILRGISGQRNVLWLSMLDTRTRELVEGLLKAQEEEK